MATIGDCDTLDEKDALDEYEPEADVECPFHSAGGQGPCSFCEEGQEG